MCFTFLLFFAVCVIYIILHTVCIPEGSYASSLYIRNDVSNPAGQVATIKNLVQKSLRHAKVTFQATLSHVILLGRSLYHAFKYKAGHRWIVIRPVLQGPAECQFMIYCMAPPYSTKVDCLTSGEWKTLVNFSQFLSGTDSYFHLACMDVETS